MPIRIEKLRHRLRKITCEIEEWIEQNDCPKRARQIKRLDKAVFLIKVGAKIMKRANARRPPVMPPS
jgi:hypothetical protein